MIRLAASDIDGTLVREGSHVIDPSYHGLIRAMRKKGIEFCVCSGRQFASIMQLFSPVADDVYFIAENGTILRTRDNILHTWTVDETMVLPLLEDIRSIEGAHTLFCTPDRTYLEAGEDSYVYHFLKDEYRYEIQNVPDLAALPRNNISKITIYHDDAEAACSGLVSSHWGHDLKMASSGKTWIDICSKEAGKGTALSLLQKHLGVSKEETVYFGDNMNDLPAFEKAGIAGTVVDARPEVREKADLIAPSFKELGVLKALQQILDNQTGSAL